MKKNKKDSTALESTNAAALPKNPPRQPQKLGTFRRYANIIRELAVADFRLKYHNSTLGYIWSMLNPMLMFGVYYFVFTQVFPSKIQDYPLFLLTGIISYAFFQDCTFSAMRAMDTKSGIMKKLAFPRVIIVFASTATCLFSYGINLLVLFALVFLVKGFSPLMLLAPIPIIFLILFSAGVGLVLATLYAFFRDISQVWGVLVLALFWLSSIVFDVSTLPEPMSTLVYFNPLTRIFVLLRHCLLYDYFDLRFVVMTVVYSFVSFILGYLIFRRYQHKFAELF